jgi:hypothetical protein
MNRLVIALYEGVSYWEIEFWRDEVSLFCSYMVLLLLSFVFSLTLVFNYQKQIGQKLLILSTGGTLKILHLSLIIYTTLAGLFFNYASDQAHKQNFVGFLGRVSIL